MKFTVTYDQRDGLEGIAALAAAAPAHLPAIGAGLHEHADSVEADPDTRDWLTRVDVTVDEEGVSIGYGVPSAHVMHAGALLRTIAERL